MNTLTYIAEPADSPRRMACRTCHAHPGEKCKDRRGRENNLYCKSRWKDFQQLQAIEQKLQQWNVACAVKKEA